jgi:hypothetical protein
MCLTMRGRLGEDRDCLDHSTSPVTPAPLSVTKGGLSCLDLCLHRTSSNAPHTVPQDLAAFKSEGCRNGFIKPLKPFGQFRMPRRSVSCCEIIGLAAAVRRSAPWSPELTGRIRGQGRWRARSKTASGRRGQRVYCRIMGLEAVTTVRDPDPGVAAVWAGWREWLSKMRMAPPRKCQMAAMRHLSGDSQMRWSRPRTGTRSTSPPSRHDDGAIGGNSVP